MRLLSVLMPRERQFFTLFNSHASLVVQGAAALVEMLADYSDNARRDAYVAKIQGFEKAADRVTHQTVDLMHNTFVTPFDRDQINKLIQRMDDILDLMQDTAESLMLYDVHVLTPEVSHLADLVQVCCKRVEAAVTQLSSMDNGPAILKICQEHGVPCGHPHPDAKNIERLIAEGYRFLMPPAPRSFAVLEQGRKLAGRS